MLRPSGSKQAQVQGLNEYRLIISGDGGLGDRDQNIVSFEKVVSSDSNSRKKSIWKAYLFMPPD